jgi:hypothetical protein
LKAGEVRLDPGSTKNREGRVFPLTAICKRRLASLMPASWNHIVEWLGLMGGLRRAS